MSSAPNDPPPSDPLPDPKPEPAWADDPVKLGAMRKAVSEFPPLLRMAADESTDDVIVVDLLVDGYAVPRLEMTTPGAPGSGHARLADQIEVLFKWENALRALLGPPAEAHALCVRIGLLPENPSWNSVASWLQRFRSVSDGGAGASPTNIGADELRDLTRDFGGYLTAIEPYRHVFDRAMRAASVIALAMPAELLAKERDDALRIRRKDALEKISESIPATREFSVVDAAMRSLRQDRRRWNSTEFAPLLARATRLDSAPMTQWCEFLQTIASRTEELLPKLDEAVWRDLNSRYWTQWSWGSARRSLTRNNGTTLLDLVFSVRHSGRRLPTTGSLQPALGPWSWVLALATRHDEVIPPKARDRVRLDLGLDGADTNTPVLVVVPASAASNTQAWRTDRKIPSIALGLNELMLTSGSAVLENDAILVLSNALVAAPADGNDDPTVRSTTSGGTRPWILAYETDGRITLPPDISGENPDRQVLTIGFGAVRPLVSTDDAFLVAPRSLQDLHDFAVATLNERRLLLRQT